MSSPLLEPAVIAPLVMVALGGLAVLICDVLLSRAHTFMSRAVTPSYVGVLLATLTTAFLVVAGVVAFQQASWPDPVAFNPSNAMFVADRFSGSLGSLVLLITLLCAGLAVTYLDELDIHHGEFYALLLFSTTGMLLLLGAVDLLTCYLGLELMSLPLYVLAGFDRGELRSNEAGLKYLLLGGVASAILLYGMSLLYGAAGGTSYEVLRVGITAQSPLALVGLALLLVGLAFKLAAVPFHQWVPDVYEGSPSVVSAFMAVAVKVAVVGALLRLIAAALGSVTDVLESVLWWIAVLSMVIGSLMALVQENMKRLLGYSTIAHAGFVLIGIVSGSIESYGAVVFYLLCYAVTALGAFAVVVSLAHRGRDFERIEDFAGLARSRPGLAACMTVFTLSLAGVPLTAGFMAKWRIVSTAIDADHMLLAVTAILASVVSLYYYLRIPMLMYMRDPGERAPRQESTTPELFVLALCVLAVLYLGTVPDSLIPALSWANESVMQLTSQRQPIG